eukprot:18912-Heterococcus_DN1.PRE.1
MPEPAVPPKATSNQMLSGKDWGDMIMLAAFKGGAAAFIAPLAYDGLGLMERANPAPMTAVDQEGIFYVMLPDMSSLRLLYNKQKHVTSSKPDFLHAAISGAIAGVASEIAVNRCGILPRLTRETGIISQDSILAAAHGVFYGVSWERYTTMNNSKQNGSAK